MHVLANGTWNVYFSIPKSIYMLPLFHDIALCPQRVRIPSILQSYLQTVGSGVRRAADSTAFDSSCIGMHAWQEAAYANLYNAEITIVCMIITTGVM